MTTIDPLAVQAFHTVLETKNMTTAAGRLGLPKSTISRRIASLEETVGVQLLRRSTRRVEPTEAGVAFGERSRQALSLLDEAALLARDDSGPPRGRVRITAPPDLAEQLLTAPLAELRKAHPLIEIELGLFPRRADLVAEGWDLALRVGSPGADELIARPIGKCDGALFASPDYLARRGTPRNPLELEAHDWVEFVPANGAPYPIRLALGDKELVLVRKGIIRADDMRFCRTAAEAGCGIVVLETHIAAPSVAEGKLVRVLPRARVLGPALHLVYSRERYPTRAAKIVREALLRAMKSCPG